MWFKNLYIFQLEKESFIEDHAAFLLHQALGNKQFTDCKPTQRESAGWVPPLGKTSESYAFQCGKFILLTMSTQERMLPASVVRETLAERVVEIEKAEARKVGSKEKKELTESIEDDLLPRAFTRTTKLDAWIDIEGQRLVINTPSASKAEAFATLLRKTIGSLPASPLKTDAVSPNLTHWLLNYRIPRDLAFSDECELQGSDGSTTIFRNQELGTDEVKHSIELAGKTVSKVALCWAQKIIFTVGDDLVIKKLSFMDVLEAKMNEEDPQDHEERMAIEFTLMSGEVSAMLNDLLPQIQA